MSKSILIIDTPKSCHVCPLFSGHYSDMTCGGNGESINYPYPDDKVQEWCPLLNAPNEMQEYEDPEEQGKLMKLLYTEKQIEEAVVCNCQGCIKNNTDECMHCMRAYSDCYES